MAFVGKADSVDEIMWIFSQFVLASDDAAPLLGSNGESKGLISWVPAANLHVDLAPAALRMVDPSFISRVTRDFIELDMLIFKTIPSKPSRRSMNKAAALIEHFRLEEIAKQYRSTGHAALPLALAVADLIRDSMDQFVHPKDVFVKTWIAHGIDCGPAWMPRFPDLMEQLTCDESYGVVSRMMDDNLLPAGRALSRKAAAIARDRSQTSETAGQQQIDEQAGHEMARFLRTILDPRLKFFATSPRRLAINADDYAMADQSTNVGYAAIPLAVAHAPECLDRVWVIEPFDPEMEKLFPEKVDTTICLTRS